MELNFKPLTPETWRDFSELFSDNGVCDDCWCMFWRVTRKEFNEGRKGGNRKAMKALVESGVVPGIMAYENDKAVGWVSIAPRQDFASLERSPQLKRLDDQPVWAIVCFYAAGTARGGMMAALIEGAVDYARSQGAHIVEAYPDISTEGSNSTDLYMGSLSTFLKAGFKQVADRGSQAVVRLDL